MNYNVLYAWSDESQFLMQHSGTIRIWHKQHENKDPSCQHCQGDFLGTLICNPVIVSEILEFVSANQQTYVSM